jgi:type VI secretion system protein ImpK
MSPPARSSEPVSFKFDRLVLLYEGILTAIVRVQTARQQVQDVESFRTRMTQALREISSVGPRRGYSTEDIQDAHFAVVAFLDETVLTTSEGSASQWAGKSLCEELFGQRSAGELFFKKLESLRANRDSPEVAEVLEVYYFCLLLGYEGKFSGGSKTELQMLIANLRDRIERVFGRSPEFSPDAELPDEAPLPVTRQDPMNKLTKWFALGCLVLFLLCLGFFYMQLQGTVDDINRIAEERVLTR